MGARRNVARAQSNAAAVRRYRERHPAKARAALYDWRRRNRRKVRIHKRRQTHRRLGYGPDEVDRRFREQHGQCATCPKPIRLGRGGWRQGPEKRLICQACWWDERLGG